MIQWEWFGTVLFPEVVEMSKQVHVRMDDSLYEALSAYTGATGQSVQDCISVAIMQMLGRQKSEKPPHNAGFTFIDLFAGIGGIRMGFDNAFGKDIETVYVSEWDQFAQKTYRNFIEKKAFSERIFIAYRLFINKLLSIL